MRVLAFPFSGAVDWQQRLDEGGPANAERHLLDCLKWSGLARLAGAVWLVADGLQAVQRVVESRLIEKIFHELGEDTNLQDIGIDKHLYQSARDKRRCRKGAIKTRRG